MREGGANRPRPRLVTTRDKPPHGHRLDDHEKRIEALETAQVDIAELVSIVKSSVRYIKLWGPMIATAAVTSGVVSGRWGAFLSALFH